MGSQGQSSRAATVDCEVFHKAQPSATPPGTLGGLGAAALLTPPWRHRRITTATASRQPRNQLPLSRQQGRILRRKGSALFIPLEESARNREALAVVDDPLECMHVLWPRAKGHLRGERRGKGVRRREKA